MVEFQTLKHVDKENKSFFFENNKESILKVN